MGSAGVSPALPSASGALFMPAASSADNPPMRSPPELHEPIEQCAAEELAAVASLLRRAEHEGRADVYHGKRRWKRYDVALRLEASNTANVWAVTTRSVGGGGVAFWSRRSINIGDGLVLREWSPDGSGRWISARVTHVTPGLAGALIGVAFDCPIEG